ncbi:uncharacterized protein LOC115185207 isoform X2 [Salmo trutta]|uniref:uncharacterized protein LOC115185207 isoform X2 n=1 Tax=Salmo trutta TaxID=8032 RepID=UPI001131A425|nr:uncharacterized protein LOC115185207 isoform X2 [Salmo trutta]
MALRTAGSVLVVFLWSVAVVLGKYGWSVTYTTQSICALKGSTVDLSCSFRYPRGHKVTSTFWFTEWGTGVEPEDPVQDPEYAGHVEYHGDKEKDCTLRITDLRERDSSTYWFRLLTDQEGGTYTGSPGVTLSVTGLQVKVTPAAEGQKTLTCSTTCTLTDNPTYIWYKNGQRLDEPTSQQYSVNSYYSDSYSCAVKGHADHHSPAVCVRGESCMNVTYTHQSICALKGSTVDISCFYTHPSWHNVTEVSWFNKWESGVTKDLSQDSEYTSRVEYHRQTDKDSILRITDLRESDSTEYKFRFTTNEARWGYSFPGTTLTVTGFQVKVTGGHQDKTLTCITTCTLTDNPTYIWYKNGQHLDESTSPQYKYSASSNYEDSYSCAVKGHEDIHSPAVCVQGQDCSRVTYTKRRICVLKGSTVDISCTYVGYDTVTSSLWFSPKRSASWTNKLTPEDLTRDPGYAGRVEYAGRESGTYRGPFTLRITDLREEDSAEYRFTFKTYNFEWGHSFPGTTLSVTGLQVKVTPAAEGQKTLTCSTNCTLTDNPTYIWYKNGKRLDEPTSQHYSSNTLVVLRHSADSYSCAVEDHETLHSPAVYAPKNTSVSVRPSGEIVEGSSVTLTCSSDANPPVDIYTWYKKNGASLKGSENTFLITNISSEDSGEYYCEAESIYGSLNSSSVSVDIKYGPKNTSVSVSPSGEIVEGSSVTLTCSSDANPPVDKYTWYKKNVAPPKASGQSYSITNIISEDRGEYYCEAENTIASKNSTTLMIIVAVKQTSVMTAAVGIIVVVLVLILCLSGLMWFRKKASNTTSDTKGTADGGQGDSCPVYDNISGLAMTPTAAQTAATDDQDDVHYTSVHFSRSKNQEVPQPQKEDEDVQYAALKFNLPVLPPAAQAAEEDSSVLYSTVNKP